MLALVILVAGIIAVVVILALRPKTPTVPPPHPPPPPVVHHTTVDPGIYVTGGYTSGVTTNPSTRVFKYDPANGWKEFMHMNYGRARHTAAALGKSLCVVGGDNVNGFGKVPEFEQFDDGNVNWTTVPRGNKAVSGCVGASLLIEGTSKFFIAGGYTPSSAPVNTTYYYDDSASKWKAGPPMNKHRTYAAGAVHNNNKLFITGGNVPQSNEDGFLRASNTVEYYDASASSGTWKMVQKTMSTPRIGHGAAVVGNILYIIGGMHASAPQNTVETYDIENDRWGHVGSLNEARMYFATAVLNDKIYVIGGQNRAGANVGSCEMFDPGTAQDGWTILTDNIGATLASCTAVVVQ